MIKLLDIQNALTKLLNKHYPNYDIIKDEQMANIECPTLFVNVRPVITINHKNSRTKTVNVDITYVEKEDNHNNNLIIIDELENIFTIASLKVDDTYLIINNLSFSEPSFLICSFTVEFSNSNEEIKPNIKMEELNFNMKL